eukprot:324259-Rhodomonas_salina.4
MIGGHRYISILVVQHSSYMITILHKDSADFNGILNRIFAKIGYIQKRIQGDGAGEFYGQHTLDFLTELKIDFQITNPQEQFQNGLTEKMVDTLGKGVCTLLLQSQLPPEFWGVAMHYYTDCRTTPHLMSHGSGPLAAQLPCFWEGTWLTIRSSRHAESREYLWDSESHTGANAGSFIAHNLNASTPPGTWSSTTRSSLSRNTTNTSMGSTTMVKQMLTDAYGEALTDMPLEDILQLPLPHCTLNDDSLTHYQLNPDDCDVHPALRSQASDSNADELQGKDQEANANTWDRGGVDGSVLDEINDRRVQDGVDDATEDCWGSGASGGSNKHARQPRGVIKAAKRQWFSEAPCVYGDKH